MSPIHSAYGSRNSGCRHVYARTAFSRPAVVRLEVLLGPRFALPRRFCQKVSSIRSSTYK